MQIHKFINNPCFDIRFNLLLNYRASIEPLKFYESPTFIILEFRDWTSTYRDQKSTIKRCKWKVTGENWKSPCKWKLSPKIRTENFKSKFAHKKIVFFFIWFADVDLLAQLKRLDVRPYPGRGYELHSDFQDKSNGSGDVLHFQRSGCWGDIQARWCSKDEIMTHLIVVKTITTAGCVKKSVKCKIFQLVRERNCFDIAGNKSVVLQKVCKLTHSVQF